MAESSKPIFPIENVENIIEIIAKREKFINYKVTMTNGSAKGENFLGVLSRVKIEEKENIDTGKCLYLIIKSPPSETTREVFKVNKLFCREVFVYTKLFPALDKFQSSELKSAQHFKLAKCYGCSSENRAEYLALEDLNERGFKMFNRLQSFDIQHMLLIVENLANYHALSFAMKDKEPNVFHPLLESVIKLQDSNTDDVVKVFYDSIWKTANIMNDPSSAVKLKRFSVNLLRKLNDYLNSEGKDRTYNVFTHGDSWCNNFVFNYVEEKPTEVIILDWQIVRYASPVTDLAYLLFTSTDEEFRAKHFNDVLDAYYKALGTRLTELGSDVSKCYPIQVYRQHIKEKLPVGLIFSTIVVPLILETRENRVDLLDMVGGKAKNASEEIKISDEAVERLNGNVRDFIKMGLI